MKKLWNAAGILHLENFSALAWGAGTGAAVGCDYFPFWAALLLLPGIILLKKVPRRYFLLAFLLALLSGISYSARQERITRLFFRPGQVQGTVVIRDHRATRVDGIRLHSRVRGELRVPGKNEALPVLLTLTPELSESGVLYGEKFAVSGILQTPLCSGFYFDGNDISGPLPPPYGKNYLLRLDQADFKGSDSGFVRFCFLLREKLLKHLISGIRDSENQSMAARLFLGASDGGSVEQKKNFVLAGIIHLFAVSGMHVGVLALVFRMLFGFLKFRIRNILLALVVILYVMCSGLAIPALRAGAMIVCWCLLRAFLFYTPNWNILSFSFFLLCVISPDAVGELGTQYSYGITAALLLGVAGFREWQKRAEFRFKLMPSAAALTFRYRRNWLRLQRFTTLLVAAVIAFAGGTMLTALNNSLFLPGSIFTNLMTVLITPFMFGVFIFKLGFGWCFELCNTIGARLIEAGFAVLKNISSISLEIFSPLFSAKPAVWLIILFYLLFFAALCCRRRIPGILLLCASMLLIVLCPLQKKFMPDRWIVVAGSSEHPPLIAYAMPAQSRAVICNMPDSASALSVACELQKLGCGETELFFSRGNSAASAGVKSFLTKMDLAVIHLPRGKHTTFFKKNLAVAELSWILPENLNDIRQPEIGSDGRFLKWSPHKDIEISLMKSDGGWQISVTDRCGRTRKLLLPWSNWPLVWKSAE